MTNKITKPNILKAFKIGSGQTPHSWSPVLWYWVPFTFVQESHKLEKYPVWQL